MTTTLPAFNPFPSQATTAVEEGSFLDTYRSWAKTTPTLMLEPVRRIAALTNRFLESFDVTGRRNEGLAVFVHGEHGSGKTHAVRAGIGEVAVGTEPIRPLPLYAKLSEPDALHTYKLLMRQLSLPELTEIVLRFLGSLISGGPLSSRVSEQFQREPSILIKLFNEHLVERGIVLQEQAGRLHNVVKNESDFQRALTYLLEPDLKEAAYRWLQAEPVDDKQMRRLGISAPLQSIDEFRYGLQLLTLLCTRAGRPLIIVLDQAERFLVDPADAMVPQSIGLLHRMVETVPEIGGMLVVASNEETWWRLPPDLRQRFGPNDVACEALQPQHAIELLGLYILALLDADAHKDYVAPWPFTDAAVRKLLRNSGGNPRGLLQLAGQAWQAVEKSLPDDPYIGPEGIPDHQLSPDLTTVEMSVRRILWKLGELEIEPRHGFQFALHRSGRSRLLIRLREALFYLDEAERAEEDILARFMLDRHDPERCILIVIGYASDSVRRLLERAYDHVLVYRDPESMTRALSELVFDDTSDNAPHRMPEPRELYTALASLGWRRTQHADHLRQEAASLNQAHRTTVMSQRYDELTSLWGEHRDSIVSAIAQARRERTQAELEELHRVDQQSRRRKLLLVLTRTPYLLTAGISAALLLTAGPGNAGETFVLGGVATGITALIALSMLRTVQSASLPQRPASLPEVQRVAREWFREHEASTWWRLGRAFGSLWSGLFAQLLGQPYVRLPEQLRSRDPYLRYGFVLARPYLRRRVLRLALESERVAVIRRTLADRLGQMSDDDPVDHSLGPDELELPEVPYIVQHWRAVYWDEIAGLDPRSRLLVALACQDSGGIREGAPPHRSVRSREGEGSTTIGVARDPGVAGTVRLRKRPRSETDQAVLHILRAHAGDGPLGAAYGSASVHATLLAASAEIKHRHLRRVQDLLSPFDGLGTFDHLDLTPELERLYLFFEQLRFFRDGGALE